jgi:DNA gyrase subunit A
MATAGGLVKKSPLKAYSRPLRSGIIAIKLREGDDLVDVAVTGPGDELILSTAAGMAIRFKESDARSMGRNSSGVKGIKLMGDDRVVGMVVAGSDACLLTACANGYGKRTPFGPNVMAAPVEGDALQTDAVQTDAVQTDAVQTDAVQTDAVEGAPVDVDVVETDSAEAGAVAGDTGGAPDGEAFSSQKSYRTQRRGGKGLRDIRATDRNGPVIAIVRIREEDEIMMISARGKIQRVAAREIGIVGRNTQGVRIMNLDKGDTLVAVKRVPSEEKDTGENNEQSPEASS